VTVSPAEIFGRRGLRDPFGLPPLKRENIVNTLPTGQQVTPTQSDVERRLRLVKLAYEMLRDMETPTDEATNVAVLTELSRACLEKATTLANLEPAAAPKARQSKLPANMYSTVR
jgi:hypothetical protein